MKLIDFEGLNCYQNALVTIADFLGVDYKRAFINLWPETDFDYDDCHKVYVTKRMPQNLEALGIRPEAVSFDFAAEAREAFNTLSIGEPFLACVDTFYIPWSPGYGAVHDLHYFAARKETPERLSCHDPTYSTKYTAGGRLVSYFAKLYRVRRTAERPLPGDTCREEILRGHPDMLQRVLGELGRCSGERRKNALMLAKYVNAMISNRYLYKHYLDNEPLSQDEHKQLFDKSFFDRWNAVKNGLYKAVVVRNNEDIISEVSELFASLTGDELAAAERG